MYSHCLYGEPYEDNSTGCHIVDERNERIELLEKEVNSFKQALNEIKEYIHSEEFFLLMNSNSMNDKNKTVCEDYFKAQGKLDNILDKVLGDDK